MSFSIDPSLYPSLENRLADEPVTSTDVSPQNAQVNELLKRKRKAREHKACYPCRQRKVKCDLSRPCQTCRDRDHPELCDYNPPNKRQATDEAENVVLGRYEFDTLLKKLNTLETSMAELKAELKHTTVDPALQASGNGVYSHASTMRGHTELHGLHEKNEVDVIHFGAGSIPTMLYAMRKPNDGNAQRQLQEELNTSIMPLFGLDESATYPFIDLWGLPHASTARVHELAKIIPEDTQALRLFRSYRSTAYAVFPGVGDIKTFESDLTDFLVTRATSHGAVNAVTEQQIFGKTYYWLGLLFAVLASGAQSTTMPRKQRELTASVFVCCSKECLRLVNYLSRANLECIQTLLIIQNVLSNMMSAGTAWSMLGLTIRLAQGLGLHQPCPPGIPRATSLARSKIWWAIIWLDSQLSIIYDRAGTESLVQSNSMPMPHHLGALQPYHSAMYRLAKIALDIVQYREKTSSATDENIKNTISGFHEKILAISSDTASHLLNPLDCRSTQDFIEHWTLRLHTSYCLAELCRPAFNPQRNDPAHKMLCVDSLVNTLDAFIGLNTATPYASQSWASMHRALSAALLLGIIGELSGKNRKALSVVAKFINAISDIVTGVDPQEIAGPIQRGVVALYRLGIPDAEFPSGLINDDAMIAASRQMAEADEFSPHAKMNDILWGAAGPGGETSTAPMPW